MPQMQEYNFPWIIYILKLKNEKYYTGITNNIIKRLHKHNRGEGSKCVYSQLPFFLEAIFAVKNKSLALKAEYAIKQLTHYQKSKLIDLLKERNMSSIEFPVRPLFDNVFIKKDDVTKTESGFHLPQSIKGRAVTGTVVAVGPGHLNVETGNYIPCSVKVGDKCFLKEFSGYIVRYKEHEVFVFKENEILGIMNQLKDE